MELTVAQILERLPKTNDVFGFCDYEQLYIDMVAKAPYGATFVEIGCFCGKSTTAMLRAIIKSKKNITLWCVDIFPKCKTKIMGYEQSGMGECGGDFMPIFMKNIMPFRRYADVRIIQVDSNYAASVFPDGSVFFCFVDGSHEYPKVKKDIVEWYPKIVEEGYIGGHDLHKNFPGVERAVNETIGKDYTLINISWLKQKLTETVKA